MPAGHDISNASGDPLPVLSLTDDEESIRGDAQLIAEDVYELAAPYAMDLLSGALFAIQSDLGQPTITIVEDVYISSQDETINGNSQAIMCDLFEVSAPFFLEVLPPNGLFGVITPVSPKMGTDASGVFLEI